MNLKLLTLVLFVVVFLNNGFSQEFSSQKKLDENTYEVEIIFQEISSLESAENIIKQVRMMEGVKEVELFYPTTNNAKVIIEKEHFNVYNFITDLENIGIKLDKKSFREHKTN